MKMKKIAITLILLSSVSMNACCAAEANLEQAELIRQAQLVWIVETGEVTNDPDLDVLGLAVELSELGANGENLARVFRAGHTVDELLRLITVGNNEAIRNLLNPGAVAEAAVVPAPAVAHGGAGYAGDDWMAGVDHGVLPFARAADVVEEGVYDAGRGDVGRDQNARIIAALRTGVVPDDLIEPVMALTLAGKTERDLVRLFEMGHTVDSILNPAVAAAVPVAPLSAAAAAAAAALEEERRLRAEQDAAYEAALAEDMRRAAERAAAEVAAAAERERLAADEARAAERQARIEAKRKELAEETAEQRRARALAAVQARLAAAKAAAEAEAAARDADKK